MKRSIKIVGTVFLFLALFFLCSLFFKPFKECSFTLDRDCETLNEPARAISADDPRIETAYIRCPEEVASMFATDLNKKAASDEKEAAPESVVIDWIEPCGYYIGTEGRSCWFLKNNRTKSIMLFYEGGSYRGWRLVSKTEGGFLLEHEGKSYIVRDGSSK
jgi:hypothetical protein